MRQRLYLAGQHRTAGTNGLPGALRAFLADGVVGTASSEYLGFIGLLPLASVLLLALPPRCADLAR